MRIIILLDKSGSMGNNIVQTIQGYNGFLRTQRELEHTEDCSVSLYTFSTSFEPVYENSPLVNAQELTRDNYKPSGGTALYDSMGHILETLNDNERAIFLIITDGQENSSMHYNSEMVKLMIEQKRDFLETVYIGSNQDAILEAGSIGSQVAMNYSDENTELVYRNLSSAVTRVRSGLTPSIQFTQEELDSALSLSPDSS